jgi:large subunit ribosomal protein L24
MKIKSNDKVIVIAGKDKGKKGKVTKVIPKINKIVVEGINIVKKHIKPKRKGEKGQKVSVNMPINVSNVSLICPKCTRPTRVGYSVTESGDKYRVCRKCKESIENKNEKS